MNAVPPNRKAIKALKPHSRKAIGRLAYRLDKIPDLLVVDLTLRYKTRDQDGADSWESVKGHSLRRAPVTEWLDSLPIAKPDRLLASIKIGAKLDKDRVDARIAFPVIDNAHRQRIAQRIEQGPKILGVTEFRIQGDKVQQIMYCQALINHKAGVREQSIVRILQTVARLPEHLKDFNMWMAVDARLPGFKEQNEPGHTPMFDIRLHAQPSVDFCEMVVNIDFDLVPCLPAMSATELLVKLLNTEEPTAELVKKNLTALQYTLCGLRARCAYKPEHKHTEDRANLRFLDKSDRTGREIQIQDVQPHDIPEFELGDNKKKIKVEDYFSNCRSTLRETVINLCSDTLITGTLNKVLPFVKDNTGAWIPLELITFEGKQPLLSFGHRNEVIREKAQMFLKACGLAFLQKTGDTLIDACGQHTSSFERTWLKVCKPGIFTSTPHMMSCVRQPADEIIANMIGIVGIGCNEDNPHMQCLESSLRRSSTTAH